MVDYDVIVVGGGLVGLFFVCLLGCDGYWVWVYECCMEQGVGMWVIGIYCLGFDVFDVVGVGVDVCVEVFVLFGGEVCSWG